MGDKGTRHKTKEARDEKEETGSGLDTKKQKKKPSKTNPNFRVKRDNPSYRDAERGTKQFAIGTSAVR